MRPFRRELKFLIHHSVKRTLLERWRRHLVPAPHTNEHAVSPILSQYYDSPTYDFYHEKLAGIRLRNKVRVRTYGTAFRAGQATFIEIKHREDDRVRKYRHQVARFEASTLDPARWEIDDPIVESAVVALRERYSIAPSAQVYYQREAYQGLVESDVRVTFDSSVIALHPGERPSRRTLFHPARRLLPDTLVILEVKATGTIPGWVHDGVVAFELEQRTLPKYVTAVTALGLVDLGRAGACA